MNEIHIISELHDVKTKIQELIDVIKKLENRVDVHDHINNCQLDLIEFLNSYLGFEKNDEKIQSICEEHLDQAEAVIQRFNCSNY